MTDKNGIEEAGPGNKSPPCIDFLEKYNKLKSALDERIVGQREAKKSFLIGIAKHLLRIRHPELRLKKSNLLLVGPSGCGKTEMVKAASSVLGIPFVIEDASKFTSTGYRGRDATDILADLIVKAELDTKWAECGIVYIDEIDKLCIFQPGTAGHDYKVSDQTTFLTLLEEEELTVYIKGKGEFPIDTKDILFIAGGAFSVNKKTDRTAVGFFCTEEAEQISERNISRADLIEYGMIQEMAGRFSTIIQFQPLSVEDLYRIATLRDGILSEYMRIFSLLGCELNITEETVLNLCKEAYNEEIGARGLKTVFDRYFEKKLYSVLEKTRTELQKEENYEVKPNAEKSEKRFQTTEV